ncbi:hypothetical protein MY11210_005460 [Beauveria gryllotalpidicola]
MASSNNGSKSSSCDKDAIASISASSARVKLYRIYIVFLFVEFLSDVFFATTSSITAPTAIIIIATIFMVNAAASITSIVTVHVPIAITRSEHCFSKKSLPTKRSDLQMRDAESKTNTERLLVYLEAFLRSSNTHHSQR